MKSQTVSIGALPLWLNFLWTFIGNAVYAGCQWGMLIILARFGNPEMVGRFALGLAITAPIMIFANMQLRAVQATDAKKEYLFGHYLALRIITSSLAVLIIIGIILFVGYDIAVASIIIIIALAKVFESLSDVIFGFFQQHERMDRIATSLLIKGPASLIALGLGIWLSRDLFWGVLGLAIAWAAILLGYDFPNAALLLKGDKEFKKGEKAADNSTRTIKPLFDYKKLKSIIWLSWPLGFSMMLISLNTNIPRYFISYYLNERELGIFAAIAYLIIAGNTVVLALGQSAAPKIAKYYIMNNYKELLILLLKLIGISSIIGFAGLIIALAGGEKILTIMYGHEYGERYFILYWIMAAAWMSYLASCMNYTIIALRSLKAKLSLLIIVSLTILIFCYILIPVHKLLGAALALLIGYSVHTAIGLVIVLFRIRMLKYIHTI